MPRTLSIVALLATMSFSALTYAAPVQRLSFENNLSDSAGEHGGVAGGNVLYAAGSEAREDDYAVVFDGSEGTMVLISADAAINTGDLTLMYWVNIATDHPTQTGCMTGIDNFAFQTMFSPPNGDTIWLHQWDGSTDQWMNTGFVAPRSEWVHLAYAYNDSTQTVRFYVNGHLQHTQIMPLPVDRSAATTHYLAADGWGTQPWKGRMDDYRLYDTALSEEQICEVIYPDGLVRNEPDTFLDAGQVRRESQSLFRRQPALGRKRSFRRTIHKHL